MGTCPPPVSYLQHFSSLLLKYHEYVPTTWPSENRYKSKTIDERLTIARTPRKERDYIIPHTFSVSKTYRLCLCFSGEMIFLLQTCVSTRTLWYRRVSPAVFAWIYTTVQLHRKSVGRPNTYATRLPTTALDPFFGCSTSIHSYSRFVPVRAIAFTNGSRYSPEFSPNSVYIQDTGCVKIHCTKLRRRMIADGHTVCCVVL